MLNLKWGDGRTERWQMAKWQMADSGRWQMADGRWQMADGRWQMADGYVRSICQYSSSAIASRPKMEMLTRILPRSGSISVTVPLWFWNGPSETLTVSPTLNSIFGLAFSSAPRTWASTASTSEGRIGMGRSLLPAKPMTPV